jgi:GNAT superfamily N-acetyltransferase
MKYRQATQIDIIGLPNIFLEYYKEASAASPWVKEAGFTLEGAMIKAMESTLFDQEVLFIAESNGKIVGFFWGCAFVEFWSGKIIAQDYMIYVASDYRKGFVGKRLLNKFEGWAKEKGAHFTRVGTNSGVNNNKDASRLYTGSGYKDIGSYLIKQL